jgi:hypothetical protein
MDLNRWPGSQPFDHLATTDEEARLVASLTFGLGVQHLPNPVNADRAISRSEVGSSYCCRMDLNRWPGSQPFDHLASCHPPQRMDHSHLQKMGATKHDSCFIYIVSTCWVNGGVVELGPNYREALAQEELK